MKYPVFISYHVKRVANRWRLALFFEQNASLFFFPYVLLPKVQ